MVRLISTSLLLHKSLRRFQFIDLIFLVCWCFNSDGCNHCLSLFLYQQFGLWIASCFYSVTCLWFSSEFYYYYLHFLFIIKEAWYVLKTDAQFFQVLFKVLLCFLRICYLKPRGAPYKTNKQSLNFPKQSSWPFLGPRWWKGGILASWGTCSAGMLHPLPHSYIGGTRLGLQQEYSSNPYRPPHVHFDGIYWKWGTFFSLEGHIPF